MHAGQLLPCMSANEEVLVSNGRRAFAIMIAFHNHFVVEFHQTAEATKIGRSLLNHYLGGFDQKE